jgi:hypothetical protein
MDKEGFWGKVIVGDEREPQSFEDRVRLAQLWSKERRNCEICGRSWDKEPVKRSPNKGVMFFCSAVETQVRFFLFLLLLCHEGSRAGGSNNPCGSCPEPARADAGPRRSW